MKASLIAIFTLTVATLATAGETATPDETEMYKQRFMQLDVNGDGALSPAEAAQGGMPEDTFSRLDANGDGLLDQQEFAALAQDTAPVNPEPSTPVPAN